MFRMVIALPSSLAKISSPGGRDCNEDAVLTKAKGSKLLSIVADGLGGHGGGDIASSAAVEAVFRHIRGSDAATAWNIEQAAHRANMAVLSQGGAKTTIAILYMDGHTAVCAHVGDTRVYQFREGRVVFQSQDHSVSQMAVAVGEITPDEIRGHADRNKLLRALGDTQAVRPDISVLTAVKDDAFLLCSDGFWELVPEREMEWDLSQSLDARDWLRRMGDRVVSQQTEKSDNYSAVTVFI